MLKEIQRSQYSLDAYYLRYFRQFPTGLEFDNLFHEQKEFIMLLTASAPSMEGLGLWLEYEKEKEKILTKDFRSDIKVITDIRTMAAKSKGISLEEYDNNIAEELRNEALDKLAERYGFESEVEKNEAEAISPQSLLDKYAEIAKNMEQNKETRKVENLDKFFKGPLIRDA